MLFISNASFIGVPCVVGSSCVGSHYRWSCGFSFNREVQPVLDHFCVRWHEGTVGRPDFRLMPDGAIRTKEVSYVGSSHFPPAYLALRAFVRDHTQEGDLQTPAYAASQRFLSRNLPVARRTPVGHHRAMRLLAVLFAVLSLFLLLRRLAAERAHLADVQPREGSFWPSKTGDGRAGNTCPSVFCPKQALQMGRMGCPSRSDLRSSA